MGTNLTCIYTGFTQKRYICTYWGVRGGGELDVPGGGRVRSCSHIEVDRNEWASAGGVDLVAHGIEPMEGAQRGRRLALKRLGCIGHRKAWRMRRDGVESRRRVGLGAWG